MSRGSQLLVLCGLAAFAFGVAALIDPGVAGAISVGQLLVTVVGLFALAIGAYRLRERYRASPEPFELPEPEEIESYPTPGDKTDQSLAAIRPGASRYRRPDLKQQLHEQLTRAAIDAQVITDGRSKAEAKRRLESGAWTDDPHAAALFLGELPEWTPRAVRLRVLLTVRDQYGQRARHAIAEIDRIVEGADGQR